MGAARVRDCGIPESAKPEWRENVAGLFGLQIN